MALVTKWQRKRPHIPSDAMSSVFISVSRWGFGWLASSINFADRRSALAASTGPKTLLFSRWLLAFLVLDLRPFAMVETRAGTEVK